MGSASATIPPTDRLRDGIWRGRPCFIVGGGPSLRGFDWSRLRGELTIAINRAHEFFDPTIIFTMDDRFIQWTINKRFGGRARDRFINHPVRVQHDMTGRRKWDGMISLQRSSEYPVSSTLRAGLADGQNSGFGALNLAVCLGANPIYLLGYDMRSAGARQKHFHSGYPTAQTPSVYPRFAAHFERAAPVIEQAGVRVVNLNRESGLTCFEFGDFPEAGAKAPLVIAYYTEGTGYAQEADKLRLSMLPLGLEHQIEAVPNLGSWQRNTQFKARFILDMMDRFPGRPLLYVDADATFERYPAALCALDADIAVHHRGGKELLSGTIYLSGSIASQRIVERWVAMNDQCPNLWDQINLERTLHSAPGIAKVEELPADYCAIFDLMPEATDPVIKHWQASRRLKKEVNAA